MKFRNFKKDGLGKATELNRLNCSTLTGSGGVYGVSIGLWGKPDTVSGRKTGSASLAISLEDAEKLANEILNLVKLHKKEFRENG